MPVATQSVRKPSRVYLRRGHPLTRDLKIALPFFEGAGDTAHNIANRARDGSLGSDGGDPPTWATGKLGRELDFDDSDDRVDVTFPVGDISLPFTLVTYAMVPSISGEHYTISIADKDVSDQQYRLGADGADNAIYSIFDGSVTSVSGSKVIEDGNYHQIAAISAASDDHTLVVDGRADGTITTTKSISGLDRVTVGVSADSSPINYWGSTITLALVYDTALPIQALADLYEQPMLPFITKPR